MDAVCCSVPEAASQIEASQVRVLCVMSEERLPDYPDIPTAKEAGTDWVSTGWRGLALPKGTAPEILDTLEEKCLAIAESAKFKEFMAKNRFGIRIRNAEEFTAFARQQDAQWKTVAGGSWLYQVDGDLPRSQHAIPNETMTEQDASYAELPWGIALLLVGCFFLLFAGNIRHSGAVSEADPGPRAVPIAMSWLLIGGGVLSCRSILMNRRTRQMPAAKQQFFSPANRRTAFFVTLTLCYIVCVPFAFYVSTFVLTGVASFWFGAKWWSSFLGAAIITSVVWGLFVKLFSIPLPTFMETMSNLSTR